MAKQNAVEESLVAYFFERGGKFERTQRDAAGKRRRSKRRKGVGKHGGGQSGIRKSLVAYFFKPLAEIDFVEDCRLVKRLVSYCRNVRRQVQL